MLNHSNSRMSNFADAVVVGYAAPEGMLARWLTGRRRLSSIYIGGIRGLPIFECYVRRIRISMIQGLFEEHDRILLPVPR
jgi:hypothetical protein